MNSIREYLSAEARRITDRALSGLTDADAWQREMPERRRRYAEMMGMEAHLAPGARCELAPQVTGIVERPAYRIEKLHFQSLPGLLVTANLYIPRDLDTPAPGVLYVCGHSDSQKVHYQAHPRRLAELGFVALVVESAELGEVRGNHHGPYREGWFQWYSRGYSPAAVEMLNGVRALDFLASRPEVDAGRLGVTGISGGGAATWWIAAYDERVRVAAPVCGTATLASQIADRTIDGHCDCMWFTNSYQWDLADVGALIAPRPLLIASADRDGIFTVAAIREVHAQLARLYEALGASANLRLVETPGPHSYHERSRTAIFSWFARHLQGREVPPEQIGDLDESPERQETEETLRVFTAGPLPYDRTPTIHDDLCPPAALPTIADATELNRVRQETVGALRMRTFGAFPASPPPLDARIEFEHKEEGPVGFRFSCVPEEGWRLYGRVAVPPGAPSPAPLIVSLRSPGDLRAEAEALAGRIPLPWARAAVEPRGTGDTAWGQELQWHLRRASAWTGRTLASMRVYDALRFLEALRSFEGVDASRVVLAARGEMAAVALYAALLDGGVSGLVLVDPPATQNAPSRPDGTGPAIEMLSCLQVTDLPQVAGLLFPAPIALAGSVPSTYAWAQQLYARLGAPEAFAIVGDPGHWAPHWPS